MKINPGIRHFTWNKTVSVRDRDTVHDDAL